MDLILLWQKLVHKRGGLTKDEEWQLRNNDLGTDGELWCCIFSRRAYRNTGLRNIIFG